VFYPRRGYNPIDPDNRADFYDAIYHSAAVVGINTSAMIEAAIIGRPVLSMLAEEFSGTQEGTIHFHHLLPENGGCVRVASTLEEHVRQLSERLHDPEGAREEARRFIASFIRPHGLDRPATPIFADAIERLAQSPAPVAQRAPVRALLLRPLLLAAAIPAAVVRWVVQPDWLKPARRRLEKRRHRLRKRIGRLAAVASSRIRPLKKPATRWWERTVVRSLRARRWWPLFHKGPGAP
jgi:hypothetical protein